jgi:hypothetical protein
VGRWYYRPSLFGWFWRVCAFFCGLFLLLTGVSWVAARVLTAVGPFVMVAGLVVAVFWLASRLRG